MLNAQSSEYSISVPVQPERLDNCQIEGDSEVPNMFKSEVVDDNSIKKEKSDEEDD